MSMARIVDTVIVGGQFSSRQRMRFLAALVANVSRGQRVRERVSARADRRDINGSTGKSVGKRGREFDSRGAHANYKVVSQRRYPGWQRPGCRHPHFHPGKPAISVDRYRNGVSRDRDRSRGEAFRNLARASQYHGSALRIGQIERCRSITGAERYSYLSKQKRMRCSAGFLARTFQPARFAIPGRPTVITNINQAIKARHHCAMNFRNHSFVSLAYLSPLAAH